MKKFLKKTFIITYVFFLMILSFEPYMSKADNIEDILNSNYTDASYANVHIDNTIKQSDGTLKDLTGQGYSGFVFNNQANGQNYSSGAPGVAYSGYTSGYGFSFGARGYVYAQSWRQTTCNDSDAISTERVCPTGSTEINGVCKKTEYLSTSKVCPDGSEENEDGNCVKEITSSTSTPTCPTNYTYNSTSKMCERASTYSCPDGYTLSGTTCSKSVSATTTSKTVSIRKSGYSNYSIYYMNNTSTYVSSLSELNTKYISNNSNNTGLTIYYSGSSYYACTSKTYSRSSKSGSYIYTESSYGSYRLCNSLSTTATYSCPTGYTLSGTTCTITINATETSYTDIDPSCESGYTYDATNGVCKANSNTVTIAKVCPTGYNLDTTSDECKKEVSVEVNKTCVSDYRMTNGTCQKINCVDSTVTGTNKTFEEMDASTQPVEVRKSVSQTAKTTQTGIYKVEFSARAKGITYKPYVVVVFDNSNSMNQTSNQGSYTKYMSAINGYRTFANVLLDSIPDAQIALVSFAGGYSNSSSSTYCTTISNGTNTITSSKFNETSSDYTLKENYFIDSTNTSKKYSKNEYVCTNYTLVGSYGNSSTDGYFDDAIVLRNFSNTNLDDVRPPQPGTSEQYGGASSTNLYAGLYEARKLLAEVTGPKYIVVISDGAPTTTYCVEDNVETLLNNGKSNYTSDSYTMSEVADDTIEYANIIKNTDSVTMFTLGYEMDTSGQTVLNKVATSTDYAYTGTSSNIEDMMNKISVKISEAISTKITDGIGLDFGFDYYGPTSGVTIVGEPVINNVKALNENWQSLGYFYIKIDPETADGWYATNSGFVFQYKDGDGNEQTIQCTDDPYVWWEQVKHKYTIKYYYDDGDGTYVQKDWSKDTVSDEFKLTKVGGIITDTFGPTSLEVNGQSRTNDYEYTLETVTYSDGSTILRNNGAYTATMTTNDDNNVICVYYKKTKKLSLTKNLENLSGNKLTDSEKNLEFKFKIEFDTLPNDGETYTYKYNAKTYNFAFEENSNYGYITLKSGETMAFVNLPSNINYTITELDTEGYIVNITKDGTSVSSITNQTLTDSSTIVFTNLFGYELPETGSHGGLIMIITSLFLIGIPVIYIAYNFYIDSKERISWR